MPALNQTNLNARLWAAADELRKTMSADVYKDYLLGLVFYKSLSDRILYEVVNLLENRLPKDLFEAQEIYQHAKSTSDWNDLLDEIQSEFGCVIKPEQTFTSFYQRINDRTFMLSDLRQAFRDVEQSQGHAYEGLFDDFDIDSKDLGKTPAKRNELLSSVITAMADIDFTKYEEDALGDAYEYLISQFASESGRKAGEFYTPQGVSKLIARIVTRGNEDKKGFTAYDPTMGSGSLLLQVRNFMNDTAEFKASQRVHYFGQELKNQTYNLARMNMMLHKVPSQFQHLRNGDTLDTDWPTDEPTNFDAVVMNPPYSQKYDARPSLLTDPRFSSYQKLPPASKADFAFLLHGYYHLKDTGTMGIVLPHGVLFRGSSEGTIREHLLRNGSIYAVIGLPPNIFFSTPIPTCVVILKKNNTDRSVLFIDASKDFRKEKARNYLDDEHLEKIFDVYAKRKDVEKYAHLASFEEIAQNDFNLNIPRYVDSSEPEEEIQLEDVFSELKKICTEEEQLTKEINKALKELGLSMQL